MTQARDPIVNNGIAGPDEVYDFVFGKLVGLNFGLDEAKAYAMFCQAIWDYIQEKHDLLDGLKQIAIANKLQPMASQLQLAESVTVLRDVRLGGVASIASVFVDHFKALADRYGLELNECSLAIAKVCLDIGSAGVGTLASVVTPIGWMWVGLSVIATFKDSYDLGKVCRPSPR